METDWLRAAYTSAGSSRHAARLYLEHHIRDAGVDEELFKRLSMAYVFADALCVLLEGIMGKGTMGGLRKEQSAAIVAMSRELARAQTYLAKRGISLFFH